MLRDGIGDYEYMVILKRLISEQATVSLRLVAMNLTLS